MVSVVSPPGSIPPIQLSVHAAKTCGVSAAMGGARETFGSVVHKCLLTVLGLQVLLTSLLAKWYTHLNCSFSLNSLPVHAAYLKHQKKPQGMQHFVIMQTRTGVVTAKTSLLSANVHLLKKNKYCTSLTGRVLL